MVEDPTVLGIAATAVIGGGAALYRKYRRGGSSDESTGSTQTTSNGGGYDFDCNDDARDPTYRSTGTSQAVESNEDEQNIWDTSTPEDVQEIGEELEGVTGVGPSRAEQLREEGFDTAADLYFASDENLENVKGFGGRAVTQIRDHIGGIDEDSGNGESNESTQNESTSDQTEDSNESTDDTDGDGSVSDETEDDDSDSSEETEDGDEGVESADDSTLDSDTRSEEENGNP